jgi:transcriptional regulator with XRE-family HTH domain
MSQPEDSVGFGTYLRDAIRAAGYTSPSQFARAVNLDPSVVLRWLNGSQRPTVASLERVAPALRRGIADLVRAAYPDRVPEAHHAGGQTAAEAALTDEISRLLASDSPMSGRDREALVVDLNRTLQPYRRQLDQGLPDDEARSA